MSPQDVADLLGQGDLVWADVGFVGDEMFLSHQSYGLVAQIQEDDRATRTDHASGSCDCSRTIGRRPTTCRRRPLEPLQVEIDGHPIPGKAALVTIANVETYRGFLSLTPAASPVDGLFDVCVIPRTTRAGVLGQAASS